MVSSCCSPCRLAPHTSFLQQRIGWFIFTLLTTGYKNQLYIYKVINARIIKLVSFRMSFMEVFCYYSVIPSERARHF